MSDIYGFKDVPAAYGEYRVVVKNGHKVSDLELLEDIQKLQAENAELFRLKEVFKARNNKALDYLYEESQDSAYDARCALEGE